MNIFNKNWIPSKRQRDWAERNLLPITFVLKFFTTWYVVAIWSFAIPFYFGQSIFSSTLVAAFSTSAAWFIWQEK